VIVKQNLKKRPANYYSAPRGSEARATEEQVEKVKRERERERKIVGLSDMKLKSSLLCCLLPYLAV
jgi:hypothetical protein